jgi:hypothetical protein
MLAPRPIDVGWIVRYKLLSGRIFVHKKDRAAILDNVTCSSCGHFASHSRAVSVEGIRTAEHAAAFVMMLTLLAG